MTALPCLDFQSPPPEEKRLPPAKFTALEPTMAPSFMPREDLRKVHLERIDLSKTTNIGRSLNQAQQDKPIKFLSDNRDIFACKPSDMLGILREITKHSLRIRADAKLVKQHLR